jgi:Lon-like ATP-dependent protease
MPKDFKTTKDIVVPKNIIDQVIGQEEAVQIMRKAALQQRHVLLIGEPGTGKSMLGMGLAGLLPAKGKLEDSLCYPNQKDPNNPLIKAYPAGQGEKTIVKLRSAFESGIALRRMLFFIVGGIFILVFGFAIWTFMKDLEFGVLAAVNGITSLLWIFLIIGFLMTRAPGLMKGLTGLAMMPKPLVTHKEADKAPFIDATGAQAGALLGDVLHDPLQSGGLGTPAHERVMPGMIHKANKGVLFIDEIATLSARSQQELLTALQEGKYQITGQSERSSGSMVRTDPVPCRFVMVAAGNMETVQHMHPALRSRIRGYGYEVHMKDTMPDTKENRDKVAIFVAQEIKKDAKIPHFDKGAVEQIVREAMRMANRKNHLTLRLRELGGLIRAAGDLAIEQKAELVTRKHILQAKQFARTLEQQIADKYIEHKREYDVIVVKGKQIGRVNGLAVITAGTNAMSGIVLPIESEVTPGGKESEIIATGKLGDIAKEAVKNVSAVIKNYFGEDIKETKDIFVQFVQTHSGVEGDSASIAVAVSIMSALKKLPVKQDYAMTGSLSVRGDVLPVGGVTSKIEAAIEAGIKNVIVPKANVNDIVLDPDKKKLVNIYPVERIEQVFDKVFDWKGKESIREKIKRKS